MNEMKLKDLFVSSLESGHIISHKNRTLSITNPENEIRIKNEGYFGQFDLVIAILHRCNKDRENFGKDEIYDNILMRTGQLLEIAKCE